MDRVAADYQDEVAFLAVAGRAELDRTAERAAELFSSNLPWGLDDALWERAAAGFHLTNLLLHLGCCALVFALARRAGAGPVAAGLASLLFGTWPRSTEMALYAIPIHAAVAYQIPLIFYGENPALTIGEKHGRMDGDAGRVGAYTAALLERTTGATFAGSEVGAGRGAPVAV